MGVPEFDESEWPILRVTFDVSISPTEVDAYLARCSELLSRRERMGLLIDARRADVPDAKTRARFVEFFDVQRPRTRRYIAGMSVVLRTAMGRGVVTAVTWMESPSFPVKSFEHASEARLWLKDLLGAH
ncbi:MAG: hypothetical protein H6716_26345 [Polyangiaceae bacterium]|nr:hypothetical protein [Polyangiaceae bacterium]